MEYACPRCGKPIQRGQNKVVGLVAGGLVGALLAFAFGSFQCPGCGKIPMKEFPPEVRKKARQGSLALVGGALLLFVLVILVLAFLER